MACSKKHIYKRCLEQNARCKCVGHLQATINTASWSLDYTPRAPSFGIQVETILIAMLHFHVLPAWISFHSDLMSILVPPAVICLGIYIFLLAAVRLVFHPLRKIPGPKLAALTGWWEFYFDVIDNGTLVKNLPQLHQKYSKSTCSVSFCSSIS